MKPKNGKSPAQIVRKDFMKGDPTDENTLKNSLIFFGSLLVVCLMAFIVSSSTSAAGGAVRILFSVAVILLGLIVFFNRGSAHGTDAVARGEILLQRQAKGLEIHEAERKVCYHPLKGFLTGLIGSLLILLIAVVFAMRAQVQTTTAGTIPSWLQPYLRRDEIASPLISYTEPAGMELTDILRMIIRVMVMPFISLTGASNSHGIYLVEKLSPLLLLLPAAAYGGGYLTGPASRAKIHTAISENEHRRVRREQKERRRRTGISAKPKEPKNLN